MERRPIVSPEPFSEKGFYLQEFRGRTLAVAAPQDALDAPGAVAKTLAELAANRTRVVVIADAPGPLEALGLPVLPAEGDGLEGAVWRALQADHVLGIPATGSVPFAAACRELAVRLGIRKLVWLDREGGVPGPSGERASFVDLEGLRRLRRSAPFRDSLLAEVERLLEAGLASVNLCTAAGLADELFTYGGSGTLFTRERYLEVRRLGIDDYGAALDLMRRGVEEGYLAPRSGRELDRVLAGGFGAFVEGHHLAGIGSLLLHAEEKVGELASLYTLTRFLGEGVGSELLAFGLARAAELGLGRVVACTTRPRVGAFFERHGFVPVEPEALPSSRWRGYDPERRRRVRCYARQVTPPP